jgi:glutaredoxin-like protein NrdH
MVKVYSQPGCRGCTLTKNYLSNAGVEFEEVNIREDEEAREYLLTKSLMSLPVVETAEDMWTGHDPDKLEALVGA